MPSAKKLKLDIQTRIFTPTMGNCWTLYRRLTKLNHARCECMGIEFRGGKKSSWFWLRFMNVRGGVEIVVSCSADGYKVVTKPYTSRIGKRYWGERAERKFPYGEEPDLEEYLRTLAKLKLPPTDWSPDLPPGCKYDFNAT